MARIRTIKPEFFRHEGLYEAEIKTKLPLRIAYAGLWTSCDREGRFKWRPRQLKLDSLPYDDVDFSRVLDALESRGFLVKYEVEGDQYGAIPSWKTHQVINNKEMASVLPEPPKCLIESITYTRESRVDDVVVGDVTCIGITKLALSNRNTGAVIAPGTGIPDLRTLGFGLYLYFDLEYDVSYVPS